LGSWEEPFFVPIGSSERTCECKDKTILHYKAALTSPGFKANVVKLWLPIST
jgi:hypothetical protein